MSSSSAIALRGGRQRLNMAAAREIAAITRGNFGPNASYFRPRRWPPYSKSYLKRARYKVPSLVQTGALAMSITATANMQYGQIRAQGRKPYAAAHQFGSAKAHIPARPYFPILPGWGGVLKLTHIAQQRVARAVQREMARILGS